MDHLRLSFISDDGSFDQSDTHEPAPDRGPTPTQPPDQRDYMSRATPSPSGGDDVIHVENVTESVNVIQLDDPVQLDDDDSNSSAIFRANVPAGDPDTKTNKLDNKDALKQALCHVDMAIYNILSSMKTNRSADVLEAMEILSKNLDANATNATSPFGAAFYKQRIIGCIHVFDEFYVDKHKEQYYKKLTKILHYYTDFEILASAENTEDEKTIVQRICGIYRKYINFPVSQMFLDVLINCKYRRANRNLLLHLFNYTLTEHNCTPLPDTDVMKYVLLYKRWIAIIEDDTEIPKIVRTFQQHIKPRDLISSSDVFKHYLPNNVEDEASSLRYLHELLTKASYPIDSLGRHIQLHERSSLVNEVIVIDDDDDMPPVKTDHTNDRMDSDDSDSDSDFDEEDGDVEPIFWWRGASLSIRNTSTENTYRARKRIINIKALKSSESSASDSDTAVAGPSNAVAGPSQALAGPSHALAGPSNAVAKPINALAEPRNSVAGPSNANRNDSVSTDRSQNNNQARVRQSRSTVDMYGKIVNILNNSSRTSTSRSRSRSTIQKNRKSTSTQSIASSSMSINVSSDANDSTELDVSVVENIDARRSSSADVIDLHVEHLEKNQNAINRNAAGSAPSENAQDEQTLINGADGSHNSSDDSVHFVDNNSQANAATTSVAHQQPHSIIETAEHRRLEIVTTSESISEVEQTPSEMTTISGSLADAVADQTQSALAASTLPEQITNDVDMQPMASVLGASNDPNSYLNDVQMDRPLNTLPSSQQNTDVSDQSGYNGTEANANQTSSEAIVNDDDMDIDYTCSTQTSLPARTLNTNAAVNETHTAVEKDSNPPMVTSILSLDQSARLQVVPTSNSAILVSPSKSTASAYYSSLIIDQSQSLPRNIFDSPEPQTQQSSTVQRAQIIKPFSASTPLPSQLIWSLNNFDKNAPSMLRSQNATGSPNAGRLITATQPITTIARAAVPPNNPLYRVLSQKPGTVHTLGQATISSRTINASSTTNTQIPVKIVLPLALSNNLMLFNVGPTEEPVKRKRGRPRKYPLPLDENGIPIAPAPKQPKAKKSRIENDAPFERMVLRPRDSNGRVRRKSVLLQQPQRIDLTKRRRTQTMSSRARNIIHKSKAKQPRQAKEPRTKQMKDTKQTKQTKSPRTKKSPKSLVNVISLRPLSPVQPKKPTILHRRDYHKVRRNVDDTINNNSTNNTSFNDQSMRSVNETPSIAPNESNQTIASNENNVSQASSILVRRTYWVPKDQPLASVANASAINSRSFIQQRKQRYSRMFHNQEVMRRKSILLQQHQAQQLQQDQAELMQQQEQGQQQDAEDEEEEEEEEEEEGQNHQQHQVQYIQQRRYHQQPTLQSTPKTGGKTRGRKLGSKNKTVKSYLKNDKSESIVASTSKASADEIHRSMDLAALTHPLNIESNTHPHTNGTVNSFALSADLEVRVNLLNIQSTIDQSLDDFDDNLASDANNLSVISEDTETEMTNDLTTTDQDSAVEDGDDSTRKSKRSRKRPKIFDL